MLLSLLKRRRRLLLELLCSDLLNDLLRLDALLLLLVGVRLG